MSSVMKKRRNRAAKARAALAAKPKKPTAAERARETFDPDPPTDAVDTAPPLPPRARVVGESARPPPRLLSKAEVLRLVPVSYPCLWAMMLRGEFPRSRQLSPGSNRVGWIESEVLAWIESRPHQRLKGDEQG